MRQIRALCLALAALALSACGEDRAPATELTGATMGTTFTVLVVASVGDDARKVLDAEIRAALDDVDRLASTWRDDSELSALNRHDSGDWLDVSTEFCAMLEAAFAVSRESAGAFDPTVGPLVNLWGFGPGKIISAPPGDAAIDAARAIVGYDGIETDCARPAVRKRDAAMYVDLSGWAKGHAVDRVAAAVKALGYHDFMVEVGGELSVAGRNAEGREWAIAVEAPAIDRRTAQSVLRLTDTSVATSGDYRNFFEFEGRLYSHTIDPRTGRPVTHKLASVTVLDGSAARADGLATALLVLGPEAGPEMAATLGVPAYFLIREADSVRELATPDFDRLRQP